MEKENDVLKEQLDRKSDLINIMLNAWSFAQKTPVTLNEAQENNETSSKKVFNYKRLSKFIYKRI